MTTFHDMAENGHPKRTKGVNGFKSPEDWHKIVKRISEDRHSTIGGAIIYLVNLGLPIYDVVKQKELQTIAIAVQEFRRIVDQEESKSRRLAHLPRTRRRSPPRKVG